MKRLQVRTLVPIPPVIRRHLLFSPIKRIAGVIRPVAALCFLLSAAALAAPAATPAPSAPPVASAPEEEITGAPDGGRRAISAEALFAAMLVKAEQGQPKAMLNVGTLYERGVGVPRNFTKALEWHQKAADAGEKEAYMRLALCYEIGMGAAADADRALKNLKKAAEMGLVPAMHKLAGLYLHGRGLPRDEAAGFDLLVKAADAGDPSALVDLGLTLRDGLFGRKAEPAKARARLLQAAEAGHVGAALAYAAMLREGTGGKAEPESALAWYLTAQKAGLKAEELDKAVAELQGACSAAQAATAEKAAAARVAAWRQAARHGENNGISPSEGAK
jgi:TPR repeat protein